MNKTKRPLTLLEIMVVIFLIGLIGSIVGYNMKGSIDEGKYFKTEQMIHQIHDVLLLEVAKGSVTLDEVIKTPGYYLERARIFKEPKKMLVDGWGNALEFSILRSNDIKITTKKFEDYRRAKRKKADATVAAEEKEDVSAFDQQE